MASRFKSVSTTASSLANDSPVFSQQSNKTTMENTAQIPAFPHTVPCGFEGMTLRDYFAAHIAAGYMPLLTDSAIKPESVAKIAYACANALMAEREK